jgi:hypothetical protein
MYSGRVGRVQDLTRHLLQHMAEYCAWRATEFACVDSETAALEATVRSNLACEFGESEDIELPLVKPCIADGRMQPHEWFCTYEGRWLKLDAATHGDNHFYPGPCDIAWDLAGAIVEWQLDPSAREQFLSHYAQVSGDDASSRIDAYELAYATFRFAWSGMAAGSMRGTEDEARLTRDYLRYRNIAATMRARLDPTRV